MTYADLKCFRLKTDSMTVATAWHSVSRVRSTTYRHNQLTEYVYQLGTCAMKQRDQGGVVDASLNVYGISNLKVAGTLLLALSYSARQ